MDWINTNRLYKILFLRRRDNGGRGHPVRASLEWALLEEQRIYLSRFYLAQKSSPRRDLYSKILRRSIRSMFGKLSMKK